MVSPHFLKSGVGCVLTFLQDAPLMLRKYPDLATVPPFKWLYDIQVKEYFENIRERVEATEVARVDVDMEQQLERKQVKEGIKEICVLSV